MKQIIAVIRQECLCATLVALAGINVKNVVAIPALGRGDQKGVITNPNPPLVLGRSTGSHLKRATGDLPDVYRSSGIEKQTVLFLPKQMLITLVDDDLVIPVIKKIISVNQSGRHGDGKIFVCSIIRELPIDAEAV